MIILDGKKARDAQRIRLKERVSALSCVPTLALIQVGDIRESSIYIKQKRLFAETIGARVEHSMLPVDISLASIEAEIKKANQNPEVHGIIIQLPLPAHLNKDAVINMIDPTKDVDGLTDTSQRLLAEGKRGFVPATAKGTLALMKFYGIDIKGKNVCVLGRSKLVGSPLAILFKSEGALVSVCHSQTPNAAEVARKADIVASAIGKPAYIGDQYLKEGVVVIDIGLTNVSGKGLVGDIDTEAIQRHASAVAPAPGGVGPMTVLSLFDNLVVSAEEKCLS